MTINPRSTVLFFCLYQSQPETWCVSQLTGQCGAKSQAASEQEIKKPGEECPTSEVTRWSLRISLRRILASPLEKKTVYMSCLMKTWRRGFLVSILHHENRLWNRSHLTSIDARGSRCTNKQLTNSIIEHWLSPSWTKRERSSSRTCRLRRRL